jgi:hypothetical protein
LCTYKTFSQDILDDHMDSQHRGSLNECIWRKLFQVYQTNGTVVV